MIHPEMMVSSNLLDEFKTCTLLQYSGKLDIKTAKGHRWTFYYRLGRIVWATGGIHPFRRWRRHMAQYCPEVEIDKIQLRAEDTQIDYWDYRLLEILHEKQKIKREQINSIVESTIAELLFDLAQQANFTPISSDRNQDVILETPMSFTSADMSLKFMQDSWKTWSDAGLANFYPDHAPILRRPEQLESSVSPAVYKNFVTFMNGKYTLRDLSFKMKQTLMPVTRSLLPYILKGIVELIEVPDLPLKISEAKPNSTAAKAASSSPLIACVDDSPQVCQMLEQILMPNGFRFVKIQDPLQALPILIEHKPDLIFLDLVMPVASGYEICAQLRRVSVFAHTPIIILTGSDGLLDRVRAKVVGSTDFISKPVAADKVMTVVRKYVHAAASTNGALQAASTQK
ncbi:two-component system response regulator [Dulcicalothrix desertica PCC 7102]|uniref:Protein PatA n=1 Tax=Dulcicalothrix desertica PCC 7102 TaxID=232991 RepID=A0A433V2R4_9CYAN|nr:response regulator [Dulcicalothrix desertica]RUT00366.1 two-component system response regulator [Dulcicalothrix desertica PCC 7102]TWH42472.1 two-component system, chemotaxis family, response regulator PixG [Dulcicalothrix desertica PCC 7102]